MAGARPRLTNQLLLDLCDRIKGGAFEQVAAESLGIPFEVYKGWLARGRSSGAGRLYRQLFQSVRQARADARLMAEMNLRQEAPKVWLLNGPGRETPELPGWTAPGKPRPDREGDSLDPFQHPDMLELLKRICQALEPFAEARAAVLAVLGGERPAGEQPASGRRKPAGKGA